MSSLKDGVYILSIDAKDIYLSNSYKKDYVGYNPRNNVGLMNTDKFLNKLDYSLDLIKLIEIYKSVYRNNRFTFEENNKSFSQRVINVTFKYSVKEYNRYFGNVWVKLGFDYNDIKDKMVDHVYMINGKVIAIDTNEGVESPIPKESLGNCFYYDKTAHRYSVYEYKIKTIRTTRELRKDLYHKGFYCDGIKFIRFKRSSGAARVGKCLFIDEKLYSKIHKWELCKLKINEGDELDLAAFEAYISLTSSSIIDTLYIDPKSILVVNDYESTFKEDALVTRIVDGELHTNDETVELSNSIWDGQSLMDISLFGDYQDKGMLLLRNQFFKSCCFNCNIQKWFKDNGIERLEQLNGQTIADDISQIKLITTPSSIKYLKFGELEQWLTSITPIFGVVKYEKKTHYLDGNLVRCHYQLINSLQMTKKEVKKLIEPSFNYLEMIKNDPVVLRHYIKYTGNTDMELSDPLTYKSDITYKLLGLNDKFTQTKMYDLFKKDIITSYKKNLREGHLFLNGNYSTICGNPIEMLYQAIGKFDGTSQIGIGKVHTTRFKYNKTILGSRSPHICQCNIWLPLNSSNEMIDKYMNPTNEIIYINSIGESVLDRLSGADFDSDTCMITDNSVLIKAGRKNINNFKVSINKVEAKKIKRFYTAEQKADLDIKTSNNQIGVIINLSQELNSKVWDKLNNGAKLEDIQEIYKDVCQLNVMSNIEIDSAKKEFDVVMNQEIENIRNKYRTKDKDGKTIKPYFFGIIAKEKGYFNDDKFNYKKMDTSMDYLEELIDSKRFSRKTPKEFIKFYELLNTENYDNNKVNRQQAQRIMSEIKKFEGKMKYLFSTTLFDPSCQMIYYQNQRNALMEYIGRLNISDSTIIYLLKSLDNSENQKYYQTILKAFFGYPNERFYELIKSSNEKMLELAQSEDGILEIFGYRYSKIYKN